MHMMPKGLQYCNKLISSIAVGHIHDSCIRDIFVLSPYTVEFVLCNVSELYFLQMAQYFCCLLKLLNLVEVSLET